MMPDVSYHVNGGPIAMPDEDFERVIKQSDIALQICQAGNIRTALLCLNLAVENKAFDRFLIATDTPTGTGMMPLGMIKSVTEMATLSDYPAEWMIAAASGNAARIYKLDTGFVRAENPPICCSWMPRWEVLKKRASLQSSMATCGRRLPASLKAFHGLLDEAATLLLPCGVPKVLRSNIVQDFAVTQQFS